MRFSVLGAGLLVLLSAGLVAVYGQGCKFTCPSTARCVSGKCRCRPNTPSGFPNFFCFDPDDAGSEPGYRGCLLFGDPHVWNFNDERAGFPLPCRHRVTEFVNNRRSCFVEVYGTSVTVEHGFTFEDTAEVKIAIGVDSLDIFFPRTGTSTYTPTSGIDQDLPQDGTVIQQSVAGKDIFIRYDTTDELWLVESNDNDCDFMVAFRPYSGNGAIENQRRVPGLFVKTRMNPRSFVTPESHLPSSFCSAPNSGISLQQLMRRSGIDDPKLALVYGFLSLANPIPQHPDQLYARECERAQDSFRNRCTRPEKERAITVCGPFLTSRLSRCLHDNNLPAIMLFEDCLTALCDNDNSVCQRITSSLQGKCKAPAFKAYCNSDQMQMA